VKGVLWKARDGRGVMRPVRMLTGEGWRVLPHEVKTRAVLLMIGAGLMGLLLLGAIPVGLYAAKAHLLGSIGWRRCGEFGVVVALYVVLTARILQEIHGVAARAAGEHLAGGRCPTCGYAMAGLKAEGDGCAVCPECGGAWRVG